MSILAQIPASTPSAPAQVVRLAEQARDFGYTNVTTGYEPPTATHIVTGTPPQVPNTPGGTR